MAHLGAPILFLELHPVALPSFGSSVEEILGFLSECGYQVTKIQNHRPGSQTQRSRTPPREMLEFDVGANLEHNTMLYCVPVTSA